MKIHGISAKNVGGGLVVTVKAFFVTGEQVEQDDVATLVDLANETAERFGVQQEEKNIVELEREATKGRSRSSRRGKATDDAASDGGDGDGSSRSSRSRGKRDDALGGDDKPSGRRRNRASAASDDGADGHGEDAAGGRRRGRGRGESASDEGAKEPSTRGRRGTRAARADDDGENESKPASRRGRGRGKSEAEEKTAEASGGRKSRGSRKKKEEPADDLKISDVMKAASDAAEKIDPDGVWDVLDEFKVEELNDLGKKDYAAFIKALDEAVAAKKED